jgi:hypothetical protein
MTTLREAAQQALEALETDAVSLNAVNNAASFLRAALEQPEQEPVADRTAFERHAESLGYSVDPDTRAGREGGYWSSHTHLMWQTWQAALEQPEQEPVAWMRNDGLNAMPADEKTAWAEADLCHLISDYTIPLYTHPPRREPEPAFDALVAISLLTHLGGEVAEYADVVEAVRRLHALNGELLAALKEAEPMLDAMLKNITRYLPEYRNMPALAKVRAAIAKAEGKV